MQSNRLSVSTLAASVVAVILLAGASSSALGENGHSKDACSVRSINGSYGFYRTGSTPDGPLAALGIIAFDGKGGATGSQNISRNGDYSFDVPLDFRYEVSEDCTGKGLTADGYEFFRIVAVDDGKTLYIFSESEGNAIYGVVTRIHGPASRDDRER